MDITYGFDRTQIVIWTWSGMAIVTAAFIINLTHLQSSLMTHECECYQQDPKESE